MSELLKCPFCGGEGRLITVADLHWIVCKHCEVETPWYDIEDKAIEAWNTRADAEIRAKAIDEFAEKIKEHMQIVGTTYLEDIFEIAEQMKGGASDGIN